VLADPGPVADPGLVIATWVQVVASVVSTIAAILAIGIAVSASRAQRRDRDFPSDKAYADAFVERVADLSLALTTGAMSREDASHAFNQAVAGYGTRARYDRDEIRGWLSQLDQRADALLRQGRGPLTYPDTAAYDAIVQRACKVATDWAYPERRRSVLTEFYGEHAEELRTIEQPDTMAPQYSPDVQVAIWLLNGLPHEWKLVQFGRRARVWFLCRIDDLKHHRTIRRFKCWVRDKRIARGERLAYERARSAETP